MYWRNPIESCLFVDSSDKLFLLATVFWKSLQSFVFSLIVCDFPVISALNFQQSIGCGEY